MDSGFNYDSIRMFEDSPKWIQDSYGFTTKRKMVLDSRVGIQDSKFGIHWVRSTGFKVWDSTKDSKYVRIQVQYSQYVQDSKHDPG